VRPATDGLVSQSSTEAKVATSIRRLADGGAPAYFAPAVVVVEHPDVDGARWLAALTLLLEAGRAAGNEERG